MADAPGERDFFIGWASPSRATLRFLLGTAAALGVLFAAVAALVPQLQASPGEARTSQETHVGVYHAAPYGHLVVPGDDGPQTVLLSIGSKFGLQGRFLDKDGAVVSARGQGLARDGRRFLEVWNMQDAELPQEEEAALRGMTWTNLGEVSLTGEIVDSKCYHGRMRPGSGKAHRACAQLCVRGGIPPVLVTQAPDGRRSHVVVVGPERSDVHEEILPFVAEPVRLRGTLWRRGDLHAVEIVVPQGVTRLWPTSRLAEANGGLD